MKEYPKMSKNILASLWMLLLLPTEIIGQCTKPATSENAVIHGSDILKDTFDIDSAVRLVCHHGYEPTSGSPRRLVCGNNNTWSPGPERFTCQKKSCGHPGELANGHYEFPNRLEFGAVITAVCNTGHFAIGEKQRSCLGDGQWDGGNFVCEVVKCEPPKPIPNGQPRPPVNEMYEYGQAVQYVCNGDNTMLGASDTVHCLENGSWSDVPRCAKVVCIRPDIPNARRVEGGSGPYGYKYTLRYECNEGYKMTPDGGKITCLEHGWSSTLICKGLCPKPDLSDNVVMVGTTFEEGSSVNLSCVPGYVTATGSSKVTCQGRKWNPNPQDFTCKKKSCGNPRDVPNGRYDMTGGIDFGSTITAICNEGYQLSGNAKRSCLADGLWDGQDPVCEEVQCQEPNIPNAPCVQGGSGPYRYKETLKCECNEGFKMVSGEARIVCEENGWAPMPKCEEVQCQMPDIPNAKHVQGGSGPYGYNSTLTYQCNDKFKMVSGEARIVCGENGWSSMPKCEAVGCPQPGYTNAIIYEGAGGPYVSGAIIKYECQHHWWHELVGSPQMKCGSDEQWLSKPTTCKVRWCWWIIGIAVVVVVVLCIVWWCYKHWAWIQELFTSFWSAIERIWAWIREFFSPTLPHRPEEHVGLQSAERSPTKPPVTDKGVVGLNSRPASDTVNGLQSVDSSQQTVVIDPEPVAGPVCMCVSPLHPPGVPGKESPGQ